MKNLPAPVQPPVSRRFKIEVRVCLKQVEQHTIVELCNDDAWRSFGKYPYNSVLRLWIFETTFYHGLLSIFIQIYSRVISIYTSFMDMTTLSQYAISFDIIEHFFNNIMIKVHLRVVIAFYQKRIVTDFARFGARQLFYSCFRQHIPKHEFSHMMASSTSEMLKCPSFHLFCTK